VPQCPIAGDATGSTDKHQFYLESRGLQPKNNCNKILAGKCVKIRILYNNKKIEKLHQKGSPSQTSPMAYLRFELTDQHLQRSKLYNPAIIARLYRGQSIRFHCR
jgi:hypothetical protein